MDPGPAPMDRIGHCDTVAELWVERQCERIAPVQASLPLPPPVGAMSSE